MQIPLPRDIQKARQLCQRVSVVVDPQIKERMLLPAVDQQTRRLPPAFVPACAFTGLHRVQQPFCHRHIGGREIGVKCGIHDVGSGQHVACDGVVRAELVPRPIDAALAGVNRKMARSIHHVALANIAAFVALCEIRDHVMRCLARFQPLAPFGPPNGVGEGLRGDGGAWPDVGYGSAAGKEPAGHSNTDLAGIRIMRDERIRHGYRPTA